jgi:hypothetical protein
VAAHVAHDRAMSYQIYHYYGYPEGGHIIEKGAMND